jgi:Protein of unknown function (DUF1566)/Ankyrin repeats (3 copies)
MNIFQSHILRRKLSYGFGVSMFVLAAGSAGFCAPIHDAARAGDLAKVEALIRVHPDLVSAKDEKYGQTPLEIAAFSGHKDVAEFLLSHKADVNAKAKNGATALHLAAAKGNKDIVELLLSSNADVNALDNDGWSPMHSAIFWNQKETADLLAAKGGKELPEPPKPPAIAKADAHAEKTPPRETGKDGQFTSYDDGTVVDTRARLMWMARDTGSAMSWPDAKKYAQEYHGAGYSDWRLPTLAEVSALYDKAKTRKTYCASAVDDLGAAADEVHVPDTIHLTCTRVWTSEKRGEKPGLVTVFDFHTGHDAARPDVKEFVDTASRVMVVRELKDSDKLGESGTAKTAGGEAQH